MDIDVQYRLFACPPDQLTVRAGDVRSVGVRLFLAYGVDLLWMTMYRMDDHRVIFDFEGTR